MILYKYVPCSSGPIILEQETVGFTKPQHFNDPFETQAAFPTQKQGNPVEAIFNDARMGAKRRMVTDNYAILSLTRSPLNPLMWSHYAEQHKGFVIGFDCSSDVLSSVNENTVPVQFGSVLYTATRPTEQLISKPPKPLPLNKQFTFDPGFHEKFQRMFLYKPSCWSYEEEVRVVKCIHGVEHQKPIQSGTFSVISLGDRELYVVALPKGAVKEVYLGVRSPLLDRDGRKEYERIRGLVPSATFYRCVIGKNDWGLKCVPMESS